jgi:hypothetical protein
MKILQQYNVPNRRLEEEEEKVTGYGLHDRGSVPGMGGSFRHCIRTRVLWISMVKRPEREPDHFSLVARFSLCLVLKRGSNLTGQEKAQPNEGKKGSPFATVI